MIDLEAIRARTEEHLGRCAGNIGGAYTHLVVGHTLTQADVEMLKTASVVMRDAKADIDALVAEAERLRAHVAICAACGHPFAEHAAEIVYADEATIACGIANCCCRNWQPHTPPCSESRCCRMYGNLIHCSDARDPYPLTCSDDSHPIHAGAIHGAWTRAAEQTP